MILLGILVFSLASALALWTMFATIAPSLDRIADALAGRPQPQFQPLLALVRAERQLAVRRWAAPATLRLREAA